MLDAAHATTRGRFGHDSCDSTASILFLVDPSLNVWDGGVGHTKVGTLPNGLGLGLSHHGSPPISGHQGSLSERPATPALSLPSGVGTPRELVISDDVEYEENYGLCGPGQALQPFKSSVKGEHTNILYSA
ncbi:hypothetical protein VTN02DRAFT_2889 [Thermoascus thermophilus]